MDLPQPEGPIKADVYKRQPFICATLKGSDNKLVKAYLDFILSEEGQALVLAQGAVPVSYTHLAAVPLPDPFGCLPLSY